MLKIKANKKNFRGSCVSIGTPRGKFLTSKFPKETINAFRNLRKGKNSSFSALGLKEFTKRL